jgi:hypothetical protein
VMADDASRLWHLTDTALLSHFHLNYPQASPWRLLTLPHATNSALTCALFRKRPNHAFLDNASIPRALPGPDGPHSAEALPFNPLSFQPTPSPSYRSLFRDCVAASPQPAVDPSGLARWRTPSVQWARRTPGWGPRTLA